VIELHFVPTPNGHKISIMLEEIGLPYELKHYNLPEGDHLKPEFRRINPNARLPAMVDHAPADGGGPFAVFETGAMLQYLAEKTGQLIPGDLRGRSLCLQWLSWQIAGFGPFQGQAHHFIRYAPEGQDYGIERYRRETERALHVLNRRLGEVDYLAGDYSIADIATWPWVRATRAIEMSLDPFPNIQRWFAAIGERPAVQRGTAVTNVANLSSLRPTLSEEQWSNLFGKNMLESAKAEG
jgi:GST-like protein